MCCVCVSVVFFITLDHSSDVGYGFLKAIYCLPFDLETATWLYFVHTNVCNNINMVSRLSRISQQKNKNHGTQNTKNCNRIVEAELFVKL